MSNLLSRITFENGDETIAKKHLNNIFIPVLTNIILSYYTSTWNWVYVRTIKRNIIKNILVRDNIVSLYKNDKGKLIDLDTYGNIKVDYKCYTCCDGPYIYFVYTHTIVIMDYYTGSIKYFNMLPMKLLKSTKMLLMLFCIKDNIMYISTPDECDQTITLVCDGEKIEYLIRNIDIYQDFKTCCVLNRRIEQSSSFFEKGYVRHTISHIHTHDNKEIVVVITTIFEDKITVYKIKSNDGTQILCVQTNFPTVVLLYNDDYDILLTKKVQEKHILVCYNKASKMIYEQQINMLPELANRNILVLKHNSSNYDRFIYNFS